jgi:hypothetical protein
MKNLEELELCNDIVFKKDKNFEIVDSIYRYWYLSIKKFLSHPKIKNIQKNKGIQKFKYDRFVQKDFKDFLELIDWKFNDFQLWFYENKFKDFGVYFSLKKMFSLGYEFINTKKKV